MPPSAGNESCSCFVLKNPGKNLGRRATGSFPPTFGENSHHLPGISILSPGYLPFSRRGSASLRIGRDGWECEKIVPLAVTTYLKRMRIKLCRVHNLTVSRWGIRMDADPKDTARYLADHAA